MPCVFRSEGQRNRFGDNKVAVVEVSGRYKKKLHVLPHKTDTEIVCVGGLEASVAVNFALLR